MTFSFAEEVEAGDREDERKAIAIIKPLWEVRQAKTFYDKEVAKLDPSASDYGKMSPLRRWLLDHPGEELADAEAGLVAKLRSGGSSDIYDAPSAIKNRNPELYERLEELGCFAIDRDKLKLAFTAGLIAPGDLQGFVSTGERTPSLIVEKVIKDGG